MTFSYDPSLLADGGLNAMRFQLGDVFVEEPEKSAYLSDQEILAALESSRTWKRAKYKLIESLLRRFSYEIDTKVDSLDLKLHQRLDAWEREFKRLKLEIDGEDIASNSNLRAGRFGRPPCFRIGQHDWRRRPCN